MGCPEKYYKEMLKRFAYFLNFGFDRKKTERLLSEESILKLENVIRAQHRAIKKM